ncbi:hypothetical protein H6P81_006288 [Aristolochia fimbriata]|uniref:Alpha-taxilin n=1 Tax=Aristolochia fimbriata TaxID=158543 RepID=A0AAV7EYA3_ARIFI|nr:hypothetical protein H6P81_006288 [Aristolochia fimbriata]
MENSAANRLPEVDSLPVGFVESSEVEESSSDYKEMLHEFQDQSLHCSRSECDGGKSPEMVGTCTGLLAENDNPELDRRNEVKSDSSHVTDSLKSEQINEGHLEGQPTNTDDRCEAGGGEVIKDGKLDGSFEVKRKPVKRSSKAEKELLEFTLKYQKVVAERDAAVAVREKLESLCRELQRQNKTLMDECKRVSTEGQNIRLDLSTKFHDAIKDVSVKLEEQKDECLAQLKENEILRNKLKHLSDQYTVSEQQFQQKLKQKTLEAQLADLKLKQQQEKSAQEQAQLKVYAEQVTQLLSTEKSLRLQLVADGEKFQQFQDALLKSNEVFETFKQEMEKMAKSIKEFKKENTFLKSKCEKSDVTLIELVEEREHLKKQLDKVKHQKEKLESLCRSLQAERKQNHAGSSSTGDLPVQAKSSSSVEE